MKYDVVKKSLICIIMILLITHILSINITQSSPNTSFESDEAVLPFIIPNITIPDNYSTIQEGINHANSGDIILVRSGIYRETIEVDIAGLFIQGESKFNTVIDGGKTSEDGVIISAPNVTLQGFTITNARSDDELIWDQSGVKIYSSNATINENRFVSNRIGINTYTPAYNLTISENEFIDDGILLANYFNSEKYSGVTESDFLHNITNNTVNGRPLYYYKHQSDFTVPTDAGLVILVNCTNITIKDLYMSHNDFSITLAYCSNCIVENVTVSDTDGEILFEHSENNTFQNNIVSHTLKGICLETESKNNIIRNNDFSNNFVGISVFTYSSDNEIYCNKVHGNEFAGIEVVSYHGGSQHRNLISENCIYDNKVGVYLQHNSCNNAIQNNTISKNSVGVFIRDSSNDNTFENNIFYKNRISATFIECTTNNWDNNYWNRPRIIPKFIKGLGTIGKIPVPWINVDRHPAREIKVIKL